MILTGLSNWGVIGVLSIAMACFAYPVCFWAISCSCVSLLITEGAELLYLIINLENYFLLSKLSVEPVITYVYSCLLWDKNCIFTKDQAVPLLLLLCQRETVYLRMEIEMDNLTGLIWCFVPVEPYGGVIFKCRSHKAMQLGEFCPVWIHKHPNQGLYQMCSVTVNQLYEKMWPVFGEVVRETLWLLA